MLRGRERQKEQICDVKQVDEDGLYPLKINCERKRAIGKANKGVNMKKYNRFFQKN